MVPRETIMSRSLSFRIIILENGIKELYRGLVPVLWRNGPSNAMFFVLREEADSRLPKRVSHERERLSIETIHHSGSLTKPLPSSGFDTVATDARVCGGCLHRCIYQLAVLPAERGQGDDAVPGRRTVRQYVDSAAAGVQ